MRQFETALTLLRAGRSETWINRRGGLEVVRADRYQTEAELAEHVVLWLERSGWTCFNEVEARGGRADIVAVRGNCCWIVETKLRFCHELLDQCLDRMREPCNSVIAAVPWNCRIPRILRRAMQHEGLGLVRMHESYHHVSLEVLPKLRRIDCSPLIRRLLPEMIGNKPGTQGGNETRFSILAKRMAKELQEGTIREVIERGIPSFTEYRGREVLSSSRRALQYYLTSGLIPGWCLEKRDGRLFVVREATK